jgi:hypothetical protein
VVVVSDTERAQICTERISTEMSARVQVSRTELDRLVGMSHRRFSLPIDLSLLTQIRFASELPTCSMSSDFSQGHFWISSCLPTIREPACFAEIAELLGTDSAPNVSELNQCG